MSGAVSRVSSQTTWYFESRPFVAIAARYSALGLRQYLRANRRERGRVETRDHLPRRIALRHEHEVGAVERETISVPAAAGIRARVGDEGAVRVEARQLSGADEELPPRDGEH